MGTESTTLNIELTRDEAWAIAELAKRIGWTELRQLSASDEEADTMQGAVAKLSRALEDQGYNPR